MIYGSNFKQNSTDSYSYQNIKGQKIINIDTDLECHAMRIILCLINELCDQISNNIYGNTLLDSITVFQIWHDYSISDLGIDISKTMNTK